MPLSLVIGVPGSGKTLFAVSKLLPDIQGQAFEYKGQDTPRRLMVGGIPDLLLDHEPIDVPTFDVETYQDEWAKIKRDPGDEPVRWTSDGRTPAYPEHGSDTSTLYPVPERADNWWLWCKPGDLIVIDECQRLFRPVPFGRKVPSFIAKLETHRHYGVDFVLITQHPQLLHTNVRNLIGRQLHVRRMGAGRSAVVYEWDHCTHPDKTKSAQVSYWRYDKKAFGLYKSAEVHTKPVVGKPLALYGIVAGVLALVGLTFYLNSKRHHAQAEPAAASSAVVPAAASAVQAGKPSSAAILAMAAAHPAPPGPDELPPLPDHVAGCFVVNGSCSCVTTTPARIETGHQRFCGAVMAGLFSIPLHRVATPSQAASAPNGLASAAPVASGPSGGV
jgi:zona occludens toxin